MAALSAVVRLLLLATWAWTVQGLFRPHLPSLWRLRGGSTSLIHDEETTQTETLSNTTSIVLPPELPRQTLRRLQLGCVEVYLLGTAHVSNDSSLSTQLLLDTVQPDVVLVELCDARISLLEEPVVNASSAKEPFFHRLQAVQQAQGGSRWQALSTVLLTSVQQDYADQLGVELGGEFLVAGRYWRAQRRQGRGVHLVLGDRPMSLTLVRAWESLGLWPRMQVLSGLVWSSMRRPKPEELRAWLQKVLEDDSDVLTQSFAELRRQFPTLHATIIAERDAWLAAKLVQTCRAVDRGRPCRLVAVVGAGHLPGITQWLTSSSSSTPEQVLAGLVETRRWKNDPAAQAAAEQWIHQVTELQEA